MDLRHFRYFVAVAEELSFTRAARRLHMSQPPLSQHVQDMEKELGTLLFDRSRSHVALTKAGEVFLDEVRKVLLQAEQAVALTKLAGRGELAALRVGYGAWAPYTPVFSRLVHAYRTRCPTVHLTLRIDGTDSTLAHVLAGELDLGIVRPASDARFAPELQVEPMFVDRLMLALPADHLMAAHGGPVALASLRDEDFLLGSDEKGSGTYRQVYRLCEAEGFKPHVVQYTRQADAMLGLVGSGLGVTILPASLRSIRIDNVVWRELQASGSLDSVVYLVHHRERYQSPQRTEFLQILHEQMGQAAAPGLSAAT